MSDTIQCCLAFSTRKSHYYQHAMVTMLSCMRMTTSQIHFHIVADGLENDIAQVMRNVCYAEGHAFSLYNPPSIPDALTVNLPPQFGVGCLYLCALHECLNLDNVIYVDGDVFFDRDIADLANFKLHNTSVAAVRDVNLYRHRHDFEKIYAPLGLSLEHYVNSGVLVMNLERLRTLSADGNIFWKAFDRAREVSPHWVPLFPDQDLLNLALLNQGEIVEMDESFNWLVSYRKRRFSKPDVWRGKILHYAGHKPWHAVFPVAAPWWACEAQSPWAGDSLLRLSELLVKPEMDVAWYAVRHARHLKRVMSIHQRLSCLK